MGEHEVGLPALLFCLLGPPLAWTLHFLVIYFLVALYCTTGRSSVVVETGIATVLAGGASVWAGVVGFRGWRRHRGREPLLAALSGQIDAGTFLLIMGILGAAYFTVLIVLEALPPLFVPTCAEVPA